MKRQYLLSVLLIAALHGKGQQLNMLTYNIHHGCNAAERPSLDGIASAIIETGADIIGLEEVDSLCKRSGNIDQPLYLGEKLKMQSVFVRHFLYQGGSYGLCLLSKYPIINLQNVRLPVKHGDTSSVACLTADIKLSASGIIKVIVVHLDYRSEESRVRQAQLVLDYCKGIKIPIVLMGDFNALPESREIGLIKSHFQDVSERESYLTYPDNNPEKKIDYIFFSPSSKWSVVRSEVSNVHSSDHLPLDATLKYGIEEKKR